MASTAAVPPQASGETVRDWVARAAGRLSGAGVDSARLDARLLMASVLGGGVERVLSQSEHVLDGAEQAKLAALLARREGREPVSQILGGREFWSLPFRVTRATLTPRPDSETLIEAVLDRVPDRAASLRILDLGTGSGCLLLSVLHEYENAVGVGVDISADALDVAGVNADALGLAGRATFVEGGWDAATDKAAEGRFDIVISNPPYIPDDDIAGLMPEVARFEPLGALAGGADGLDAYRAIVDVLDGYLEKGGQVFFEVGAGQDREVEELLCQAGFSGLATRRDSAGIRRCVMGVCQGVTP